MNMAFKRISAMALSVVLALGMCPAVAFAAPVADTQEPQALQAEASEEGLELAADAQGKVKISKTMTAYDIDIYGNKKVTASASGAANATRDCGQAGYCQLVKPSVGDGPTAFPKVGALEAFTLGSQNGYKLAAFNVTFTDKATGKQVKWTNGNGLTRLGAFNAAKTTYEFTVPDADDITVNAVWEKQTVAIAKSLTSPAGTTSASTCEAGTCVMVRTSTGIDATKYPIAGNLTAFKITNKSGYAVEAFNVTYTDASGKQQKLTNGKGLTRVGAYSATANTYEFTVPAATDVSVNVTWKSTKPAPGPSVLYSGNCGKDGSPNVTWKLYSNGLLSFEGAGDMESYMYNHRGNDYGENRIVPWHISEDLIKSVQIEDGITSITSCAFEHCASLTSVSIPSSVKTIGERAFRGCKSLPSVTLPENLEAINFMTFRGCDAMTSVTLPAGLKTIAGDAFWDCRTIESINIPASVTSIERGAFRNFPGLKKFIVQGNKNYTSPDGRCLISSDGTLIAYAQASGTNIAIPASVRAIGGDAFSYNTAIESVQIPNGVTSIQSAAFYNCEALSSVTVPASMTSIESIAFGSCSALMRIELPKGCTCDEGAFNWSPTEIVYV